MSYGPLRRLERKIVRGYLRRGRQKRPPFSVNVEPTNICNLKCPICPHGAKDAGRATPARRPRGMMSLDTFDRLVEGSRPYIRTMALYLHGEPFLNPDLPEMARRAKANDILPSLFTNGLTLTANQLEATLRADPKSLSVSMDLISPEGYVQFKGQDLYAEASEQMCMIADVCARTETKTKLTLRAIYGGESQDRLREFLDRWLGTPGVSAVQITHPFPWPRRVDADILGHRVATDPHAQCPQVWNALNVCWDGTVTPCSYDSEAECPIGNVNTDPLDAILNSPAASHFRRMHVLEKREQIPLCRGCVLPRFSMEIVTVRPKRYSGMTAEEKAELLEHIAKLRFSPAGDFAASAPDSRGGLANELATPRQVR